MQGFFYLFRHPGCCNSQVGPHTPTQGGVILTDRKIPSGEAEAQEEREKGSGICNEAAGNVLGHNLTAGCKAAETGHIFGRAW